MENDLKGKTEAGTICRGIKNKLTNTEKDNKVTITICSAATCNIIIRSTIRPCITS